MNRVDIPLIRPNVQRGDMAPDVANSKKKNVLSK